MGSNRWSIILWCYCRSKPAHCPAISSKFFHLKAWKDAALCFQTHHLSSFFAITFLFLPLASIHQYCWKLLASYERDACGSIGRKQKWHGSTTLKWDLCNMCWAGRNPKSLCSSNPGLRDLLNVQSDTQWPTEKEWEEHDEALTKMQLFLNPRTNSRVGLSQKMFPLRAQNRLIPNNQ